MPSKQQSYEEMLRRIDYIAKILAKGSVGKNRAKPKTSDGKHK